MRVLVVASEMPPVQSGVARAVGVVADGLAERGHHLVRVSSSDAPGIRTDEFRLSALPALVPGLVRRFEEFDVVHIHGPSPTISDVFLAASKLSSKRPRILYTHHFTLELSPAVLSPACKAYDAGILRLASWAADEVAVTTEGYRQHVKEVIDKPVHVVPWGYDQQRFKPNPDFDSFGDHRPLRILFLGQMRLYKGPDVALEAVGGVPGLELSLCGAGPMAEDLAARAEAFDNVSFNGRVADEELPELFASHDVIVLPSTTLKEAFGIVLVEGMATGCIPVASDMIGLRDVAGPTGRLVSIGDTDGLRRTLLDLARSPSTVHSLRQASMVRAKEFNWLDTIDSYEAILQALADGHAAAKIPSRVI